MLEPFKTFTGLIAPLDRANVDTDAIIPKQFLKSIKRSGFGSNLFDDWRYLDQGEPDNDSERRINPAFILNIAPYDQSEILLARENFGCGSSREHAVWALSDFGFRAVLAPGFSDIFYSNSFKNGFLPVCLKAEEIDALFVAVESNQGVKATINLDEQYVQLDALGEQYGFEIEQDLKHSLLNGLDDIALTLEQADRIRAYEEKMARLTPWLFGKLSA